MKKVFFTALATMTLLVVFAGKSQAQNGNSLENRVRAAAVHCAQPYRAPHSTIELQLLSTGRCIDGGTVFIYDVYVFYNCPPNLVPACTPAPPVRVATVTTDCNGRVNSVTCY